MAAVSTLIKSAIENAKSNLLVDEILLLAKPRKLRFTTAIKQRLQPVISLYAYQPSSLAMLSGGVTPSHSLAGT